MITENLKASDAKLQSLGLKFSFITQIDKLIIQVFCQKFNKKYTGQIQAHPLIDFDLIKQSLEQGEFKALIKNEDLIKIRIGGTSLQFLPNAKSEIQQLKEIIGKISEKQFETQLTVKKQQNQILELQKSILDIKQTVEKLNLNPHPKDCSINKPQQNSTLISQLKKQFQSQLQKVRTQILQSLPVIQNLQNDIQKVNQQIWIQNHKIQQMQLKNGIQKASINIFKDQVKKQIDQNKVKFQNLSKKIQQIQKQSSKIDILAKSIDKFQSNLETISINQKKQNNLLQFNTIDQVRPSLQLFKWSKNLCSKMIKINSNVVSKNIKSNYYEFCLTQISFSKNARSKQIWAIKMKDISHNYWIGICLRKSIQKNNFNDENIQWRQRGHGMYLINNSGYCLSHSQRQFDHVNKSFKFDQKDKDLVFIEYDPIEWKLTFRKNQYEQRLVMSIIPPPEDDCYHPCVGMKNHPDCSSSSQSAYLYRPSQYY